MTLAKRLRAGFAAALVLVAAFSLAAQPVAAQIIGGGIFEAAAAGGGGGGGVTATFRSASQINSGSPTFTLPLPTGAQAGDVVLVGSDNSANFTATLTLAGGGACALKSNFATSYGGAHFYGCLLGAGDLGGGIAVTQSSTSDNYFWAADYAISGGTVATITAQNSQIVASGDMTFGSFTLSGTHVKTVILGMTFGSFTFSTPTGWTPDVNSTNVPATPGFGVGAFSKASGTAPTFTGFTSQAFGVQFELAS
jgi:hypothetical protein